DLSRTVGWCTSKFPLLLDLQDTTQPGELLRSVKEQIRHVPNAGIGYGLLRYMQADAAIARQMQLQPDAQVLFNYLGQLDQTLALDGMFGAADETSGPTQSTQGLLSHAL